MKRIQILLVSPQHETVPGLPSGLGLEGISTQRNKVLAIVKGGEAHASTNQELERHAVPREDVSPPMAGAVLPSIETDGASRLAFAPAPHGRA
jgi:hypothetical protein